MTKYILSFIASMILISGGLLYLFRYRYPTILRQLKHKQTPLTLPLPTAVTSDE